MDEDLINEGAMRVNGVFAKLQELKVPRNLWKKTLENARDGESTGDLEHDLSESFKSISPKLNKDNLTEEFAKRLEPAKKSFEDEPKRVTDLDLRRQKEDEERASRPQHYYETRVPSKLEELGQEIKAHFDFKKAKAQELEERNSAALAMARRMSAGEAVNPAIPMRDI